MTMLTRVATEQAPLLTAARPDLPGRLGSFVAKCLAKKPADRYATYAALSSALEPFRSAAVTPARPGRRFLAGMLDSYVASLPVIPLNMYLGTILDARNRTDPGSYALKACTGKLASYEKLGSKMTAKQQEDREAIEVYIAEHLGDAVEESAAVARSFPAVNRVRGEHAIAARAIANHPQRSPAQVKKADEVVAKLLADQSTGLNAISTLSAQWTIAVIVAGFTAAFVGAMALIGALATRDGFTFRPFGAALVTKKGSQASRLRALIRTLVACSPIALLIMLILKGPKPQLLGVGWMLLETSVLLVFLAGAVWALLHPVRGIQDRIAGTWIVPR